MTSPVIARRLDRAVLVQGHCSALELGAALCLRLAADRLSLVPGSWGPWTGMLFAGAGLALAAAVLPWLTAGFTVRHQRGLLAAASVVAACGVVGAAWAVDLVAVLGVQLLVGAAALAELGNQRRALWWFWVTVAVLVLAVAGYHLLVDVRPRPE